MPPLFTDKYIYATTHEAKSNLAKYIRMLEDGEYEALFIKRYNDVVAFMMPYERRKLALPAEAAGESAV